MKKKLHIFGCSHSNFQPLPKDKLDWKNNSKKSKAWANFWGERFANELGVRLYPHIGLNAINIEYILVDIYERILANHISKDDIVLLNTSYPLRFGTPRLQGYARDGNQDYSTGEYGIEYILGVKKIPGYSDKLKKELTFDLWYKQTFAAEKLLSSVCNNVYQWTLLDTEYLDSTFTAIQEKYTMLDKSPQFDGREGINQGLNSWKNLIKHPEDSKDWDSWILSNSIGHIEGDFENGHLHSDIYKTFVKYLLEGMHND